MYFETRYNSTSHKFLKEGEASYNEATEQMTK